LAELLTPDVTDYLITRLSEHREEEYRMAIAQLLYKAGGITLSKLLNALVDTKESQSRRFIFDVVVQFGDAIREHVNNKLADERWFVVRQMVAILGELGGEDSITSLEDAYLNADVRIKKEVLKSLARIPSNKSKVIINDALKSGDRELLGQAIISTGIIKDSSSVDMLGELVLKGDSETKKEAIKAIGMIGDQKGLPYLTKLLFKRKWFGKDSDEDIKELAVISLGKIGGEEALFAAGKVMENSKGRLYNTAKRILETTK
ncbi:MAG: HEAT repeat domain-containing protein, partial [Deltaproteobacteria bacterium]|nr:HEAT repeat domain-containing protein [Deltaproteobacteria bacterium]